MTRSKSLRAQAQAQAQAIVDLQREAARVLRDAERRERWADESQFNRSGMVDEMSGMGWPARFGKAKPRTGAQIRAAMKAVEKDNKAVQAIAKKSTKQKNKLLAKLRKELTASKKK